MISKILGTAITGIGGHYLNRRWDKAVLFLSFFIFYCVFCWVAVRTYLFSSIVGAPIVGTTISSEEMIQQFKDATTTLSIVYLAGILILWIISIIVTIIDGKK